MIKRKYFQELNAYMITEGVSLSQAYAVPA